MIKTWVSIAIILLATGCYWENIETVFPENEFCYTVDVSFAADVVPIFEINCYSCHSNANAPDFASGLSLEDYEDVSAASAQIVGAINHSNGFMPMPQGQEKLDSCQISTVDAWINQGSLNN